MKKLPIVIFSTLLMFGAFAVYAGDVTGSVVGEGNTVVWLEGSLPKAPPQKDVVISQHGIRFSPDFSVIVAGTSVAMPNDDDVAHNVYSLSSVNRFNLGVYSKGESKTVKFDQSAVVGLKCWLHQRMNATIVVVPNRFYAVAENGSYRIASIPAGTYKLVSLHVSDGTKAMKNVTVPSTGSVKVDF